MGKTPPACFCQAPTAPFMGPLPGDAKGSGGGADTVGYGTIFKFTPAGPAAIAIGGVTSNTFTPAFQ